MWLPSWEPLLPVFFLHRRTVFPPSLAAHLLEPRKLKTVSSPFTGNAKPAKCGERAVLANLSTVGFSESVGLETVSGPCSY